MDLPRSRSSFWAPGRADTPGRGSNRRARGYSPDGEPRPARMRGCVQLSTETARASVHAASGRAGVASFRRVHSRSYRSCARSPSTTPDRAALPSTERQSVHARLRRTLATLVRGRSAARRRRAHTPLADGFDCISGDSAVALGTLIRPRVGLDVFVERRLVDVSSCHRSHRVSGTRQYSEPSPIEGTINSTQG